MARLSSNINTIRSNVGWLDWMNWQWIEEAFRARKTPVYSHYLAQKPFNKRIEVSSPAHGPF